MKQANNQTQTIQVLYELALSIGTSLDLQQMLNVSMEAFAEKLGCAVSTAYRCQTSQTDCQFEAVGSNKPTVDKAETAQMALAHLPTTADEQQMAQFVATLPLVDQGAADDYYHLLDLPGFGVLLLIKDEAPLDEKMLEAIRPLQDKLATAANACLAQEAPPIARGQSRAILESITTPLLISRISDGLILYANDMLADMIGSTAKQLMGNITPDFYANADDRKTLLTKLQAQGILTNYELQIKRSNGELIWVLLSIKPFNYQGDPALIATFLEITERKQTLQQLEDSRERSRAILESVTLPLIISRLDDGTVLYANDRAMDMMGMAAEEMIGNRTPNFYHNLEDRAKVIQGALAHGGIDNMELPILRKGEVRWALISNRLTEYDDQQAIITTLVDITDRKLAEETQVKRAAELETVARVSASTASILETDKLLQEVVDLTKERFGLYHAHIYLLNKAGDTLVLAAGAGEVGRKMVAEKRSIPLNQEQSLVAQAARTHRGVIENDVLNNPAFLSHPLLPDTKAEMAVPVLIGDRVIGVLDTQADQVGWFTQQDVLIKTTLASQIAVALENARSFEAARTSLAETEALLDITKESSRTLELQTILESVLDKVLAATQFEAGLISLENPETHKLELFSHRLPTPFFQAIEKSGLDNSLCDLVYRRQESIVVVDLTGDTPVDVSGLVKLGFQSYQGVPIAAKGGVFGTICLFSTHMLSSEEANTIFLQAVGQQVGIAIQNANLLKQTQVALVEVEQSQAIVQEYLDMQRVLHEINTDLLQTNDLDEMYQRAIELAHTRLGFERIGMYLLNESQDTLLGTYGVDTAGNVRSEQAAEHIITDQRTIDTYIHNRTRLTVEEDIDLVQGSDVVGHGWHLGAAMWAEESPIGAIFADNLITGQPLKPYQSELLFAYATTVANLIARRRIDERVRERETLLRTIIDSTPDWIFIKDKEHRYQLVNRGYANALHIAPDEFIGKDDLELGFPEELVKGDPEKGIRGFWADDRLVMNSGEMQVYPDDPATIDGEVHTFHTIKTPLKDTDGQAWGVLAFARDITERMQTEANIRERETLLRTIIDSTPDWIFVKDRDHRYQLVNQGYADSMQIAPEEFIGKNDLDIGFPEEIVKGDPEKGIRGFWADDNEIMDSGERKVIDEEPAVVDGEERVLHTIKVPLHDADGEVNGLVGFVHDITKQKATEAALRESESRSRNILDSANEIIFTVNGEGVLTYLSPAWTDVLGFTVEEGENKSITEFVHPEDVGEAFDFMNRIVTTGESQRGLTYRIRHQDGSWRWFRANGSAALDEEGNFLYFVALAQDITEQKTAEEALQAANEYTEAILQSITVPILISQVKSGEIRYANEHLAEMVRLPLNKLVGNATPNFYVHNEDRTAVITQIRAEGSLNNYQLQLWRTDGELFWALLTARLIEFEGEPAIMTSLIDITDRKAAEEKVRANETLMRTIIDSTPDWIFVKDRDHRYQLVNQGYANSFGLEPEAFIGKNDLEIGFPEEIVKGNPEKGIVGFWPDDDEVMARGETKVIDVEPGEVDGQEVFLSTIKSPLKDEEGNATAVVGFVHDITERIQSERMTREREALLRTIIDSTPDWIFVKDRDHRYRLVNQGYADSMHIAPEEFIGKNDLDIGFPEEIVKGNPKKGIRGFWADDNEIMASGERKIIDEEPAVIDGEARVLHTVKVPLRDAEGDVNGLVGFVHDITSSKEAQEVIAKRAAELGAVAEVSTTTATILDANVMLQAVVDLTKKSFDLYHAHIYLLDEETEMLVLTRGAGEVGQQMVTEGRQIPLLQEQSLVARAARLRRGVVIKDVKDEPGFLPHPLLPDTRAEMAVPLVAGEQVLGVLDVQYDQVKDFAQEDISVFTALAAQTAVALQNARLFTQSEERAKELAFVNRIVTEINTLDTRTGLQFLAKELGGILQTPSVVVGLVDSAGTILELVAALHPDEVPSPVGSVFPVAGDPIMGRAIQTRQTVIVEDVANFNLDAETTEVILSTGTRSMYVIPMIVGRDLIGTVSVNIMEGNSPLTPDQLELAETTVYQAATAVQNARLFEQVQTAFRNVEQSQAELSQALEIAKLGYWEYDVEQDLFTFNDQFYALFHTTAEAHGGYQLSSSYYAQNFVHPDDMAMVGSEIGVALSSTDQYYTRLLEHRILFADGGIGHISVNVNLERDEQGNIIRFYGANQDITVRKAAELKLQENQERLAEANRVSKLYPWEFDVATQMFTFTPEYYELLGTSVEENGGLQILAQDYATKFVPPDEAAIVANEVGKALATDDPNFSRNFESINLTTDGKTIPVRVRFRVVKDAQGNTIKTLGANQDITEQKAAEASLRRSEADLSQALEIAKLGYWEYDVANDLFTFNDQFYSLFHTTAEAHGGYQLSSGYYAQTFVYPDDMAMVGGEIGKALSSTDRHYTRLLEHRILYADGGIGYISVNVNVERDEQGNIVRFYGANQDITDRKLIEQAVAKQAQELQIVAELSTTLATTLEQEKLLQEVVDLTKERFDFYHAQIYLLNVPQDRLTLVFGAGDVGRQLVAQKHHIALNAPQSLVAQAARSGQAVVVNDVRANPDWLPNKLLPETQGEMVVPLIVGDRVVGVLDVQAASINRFTDLDVQIQTTLAAQVSIALENARSFEQAQTAVAEMNALTRRLTREGWDEYFDKEAQETLRFLFDGTSVHEAQDTAVVSSLQETPDELLERPIEVRGVKIGKMALVPEEEDPELEEVFNSVMQQLSAHIENLRLTEQVQTSLAQTEALYTGSERIVLSSTEADVLESLIYSTQLRHLDRANIFLFDEPVEDNVARDVTAVAVWEHEGVPHTVDVGTKFTVQQVPFMSMINSEASMVVEDIRQDPRIDDSTRQILEGYGMISFVLFPMVVGSQWLGMVSGQSAQPLYMNEVQRRQASSLVSQASVVLQTTILFRQEQARARREQMLRAIAAKVRSSTDVDSIMRTAVTEIGRTLGRRAFIKLSDEQLIAAAEENGVAL